MNSRLILLKLAALLLLSQRAYGLELSLSTAHYEPFDGIVDGLFKLDEISPLVKFGMPLGNGINWNSQVLYFDFESRVANLEIDTLLVVVHSGFRKIFDGTETYLVFKPFIGASLGLAYLQTQGENEALEEKGDKDNLASFAFMWEIGGSIQNVGIQNLDLEMAMQEVSISRQLFGNINIGGRFYCIGLNYRFGQSN